jgi:3-hydroxyisobutyrate dehydrogenase
MATTTTKIGFVGLGHMGGNMAARFLAADYLVFGESRDRRHADDLVHKGLEWRDTPREIAEAADVLDDVGSERRRPRGRRLGS